MLPSPQDCVRIVKYLQDKKPDVLKEATENTTLPNPQFHFYFLLERALNTFCKQKNVPATYFIGNSINKNAIGLRTTFIAVIYKLYNPEIFTDYSDKSRDGIRHELQGLIQCDPSMISQTIDKLRVHLKIYDELRNEVDYFVDLINNLVKVVEPPKPEQADIFSHNTTHVTPLARVG